MDKECQICKIKKDQFAFAIKSARTEETVRRDAICKSCKASQAKKIRANKRAFAIRDKAEGTIEPTKPLTSKDASRFFETKRLASKVDFADLKENCDTPLGPAEIQDAIQRFNEFVLLLREGYAEITGREGVYVRKN